MDYKLSSKIKRQLQRELMRRQLNAYFESKGFDDFHRPLYPPICWDLPVKVKNLFNKIEICPYSDDIDSSTGAVRVGWNLFALGTNRLDLGYTCHNDATDLKRSVLGEQNNNIVEYKTNPHEVINFILSILDDSKFGYVDLPADFQIPMGALDLPIGRGPTTRVGPSGNGQFYSKR